MTHRSGQKRIGRLYGVGVGPGDPELITLKAQRLLLDVPVIFVPRRSKESRSIAETIIGSLVPQVASKIAGIVMPMVRDRKLLQEYWRQAADIIWHHLNQGQDGAFVNVGDPLIYGTFIYVMQTLQTVHPEIEVEIVPGISSINAVAARAAVPLASDDENIAIIAGNQDEADIRNALEKFDAVVFVKVNMMFNKLLDILEELRLKDKSVFIRRCTTQEEEIIRDIDCLKGLKIDYFSLLIVRK